MKTNNNPLELDILSFISNAEHLKGSTPIKEMQRLDAENVLSTQSATDLGLASHAHTKMDVVIWDLIGEARKTVEKEKQLWLHVHAEACIQQVCQRCLKPTSFSLLAQRSFRFVENEQKALDLDAETYSDVLVLSYKFNALELIEDELILTLPIIPRHEHCSNQFLKTEKLKTDDDELFKRPNPFAVLENLKKPTDR
jgi:uncharacterized protein